MKRRILYIFVLLFLSTSCARSVRIAQPSNQQKPGPQVHAANEKAKDWFYGHGLGRSATNIGTAVVFPPYAIYLLGNAGLELAGFETIKISDALPEETKKPVINAYDMVTSVPGRITSAVANEEFRDKNDEKETNHRSRKQIQPQRSY